MVRRSPVLAEALEGVIRAGWRREDFWFVREVEPPDGCGFRILGYVGHIRGEPMGSLIEYCREVSRSCMTMRERDGYRTAC